MDKSRNYDLSGFMLFVLCFYTVLDMSFKFVFNFQSQYLMPVSG